MTVRGITRTALIIMLLSTSAAALAADGPKIERMEARLFYNHSGTLSDPITPSMGLWNTIIGEGDVLEPSEATLVDVVLRGEPGDYPNAQLDVVVSETQSGKIVLKQSSDLGIFSNEGRLHVPIWLAHTGCTALTVKASLRGTSSRSVLQIPFACGE